MNKISDDDLRELIEELNYESIRTNSHLIKYMGRIHVDDTLSALHELFTIRQQNAELIENSERLADDLVWASGSQDFAITGIAREGWLKVVEHMKKHTALMSRIKGE